MSKKQIAGLTVEIGGDTTKLGKALGDIDKRSSSLSKELGEINKLLKLDPGNTELLAQKQKVLTEAIGSTKDRLELLKKAHEEAAEAAKSGNGEAEETMRALEREIIATEQKLGSYEGAARETEDALNGLSGETAETAGKTAELGKESEKSQKELEKHGKEADKARKKLSDMAEKGADKAATAIKALSAAAVGAVAAIGKLVLSEAEAADNLVDLSGKTGLSTETLQKYSYAASMSGTTLETLTGAQTKLIKSMASAQKGTGDAAKAFQTLGVRVTDANGQLRNSEDVFNDALNALGHVGNETERDALAMQIFGKSARELNPLINAGEDALKRYGAEAENVGAVVSDDAVTALNDLNTEVKKTKAQFSALKTETAAEFAPVMIELFRRFQTLLAKAKTELKKPAVREAVKKLGKAITELVEKGVNTAIKLLPKLAKAASFVVSNLKPLLITAGSLWAIFKTTSVVTKAIDTFKTLQGVFSSLKTATMAAETAQEGLTAAQSAGKLTTLGLAGAAAALTVALVALIKTGIDDYNAKLEKLNETCSDVSQSVEDAASSLRSSRDEYEKTTSQSEAAAQKASEYVGRLKELERQGGLTADEQREYNTLIEKLRLLMPDLNIELDKNTGLLKDGAEALENQIEQRKRQIKQEAGTKYLQELYEKQFELQRQATRAYDDYYKKAADWAWWEDIHQNKIEAQIELTTEETDKLHRLNDEYNTGAGYRDRWRQAIDASHSAWKSAVSALDECNADVAVFENEVFDAIQPTQELSEATGELSQSVDVLEEKIQAAGQAALEAADKHFQTLKEAAQNMFDVIDTGNARSMPELIENLRKNREAIDKWHENLMMLFERGASEEFVAYLENLGLGYAETVNTIATSTDEELEELMQTWKSNGEDAKAAGRQYGSNMLDGMLAGINNGKGGVFSAINSVVARIKYLMQSGLGIHSPSTVFRGFGRNTFGGFTLGLRDELPKMLSEMRSANNALRGSFDPSMPNAALPNPLALERSFSSAPSAFQQAAEAANVGGKLDMILAAIEAGKILAIDGDKFVGATLGKYDNALGQNAILAGRGT